MTIKKILITGARGFLGSNIAKHFKSLGYETYGTGRGSLSVAELNETGLDYWKPGDISIDLIAEFNQIFDLIIHCGGSGSVGFSIENPYADFQKTVNGTVTVSLKPYHFSLDGIESPNDLMNTGFGQYGEMNNAWTSDDAKGFIKILGNAQNIFSSVNNETYE